MEWQDQGIVLGVRRQGETSVILDLLTRAHGRCLGVVHGGRSRRLRPCLQPGNSVAAVWRARLEEQLGTFSVEPQVLRAAALMESGRALHALNHLCALVRLLPERDPHADVHDDLQAILDHLGTAAAGVPAAIVRFELALLRELGFGLDLERCAATGRRDDLAYVSPKSGRAVSRVAGDPYRNRMLVLPAFLLTEGTASACADVLSGFALSGFFLDRDVFAPRGLALPDSRAAYLRALA